MGLSATRKTATEEDRGEYNKDPDSLIKQSIARQVARGVLQKLRDVEVNKIVDAIVGKVLLSATLAVPKKLQDKLLSWYVTLGNCVASITKKAFKNFRISKKSNK